MYYMIRNHLYLKKNYKTEFPKDLQETQKDILLRLKNNFLYRKDRLMLIKLVIKAFRDYKRNNMGKFK
ncbi:MAG: hypothetical protein DI598_18020 [Pseudopedobacter saltans]|uniref:Uncharacterized protein n=1 Tax=Pseudopedobacter saltans TaxID=151895 RepID=A0A2W5EB50_9SPHI|nr:MAG: hypothetical protein DI598_18020 [Pseudopedobacter saltans]